MHFLGIIAEYNPFHNGHLYHINAVKQFDTPTIVVMAGDFCQRGGSMCLDAYTRAKHAILGGADLVLMMPTIYAIQSAPFFALGGVKVLDQMGDGTLSFGSESGSIEELRLPLLLEHQHDVLFRAALKNALDIGLSYPAARQEALSQCAAIEGLSLPDITLPNNILGVEYLRAINSLGAHITPSTIKRVGDYKDLSLAHPYASATALRQMIADGEGIDKWAPNHVQQDALSIRKEVDALYLWAIREATAQAASQIMGAEEGLGNRLQKVAATCDTFSSLVTQCTSKRYTEARIRRLTTAFLLDITKETKAQCESAEPYFNVLAVRKEQTALLRMLAERGAVYTTMRELKESENPSAMLDARAHDVYRTLRECTVPMGMIVV